MTDENENDNELDSILESALLDFEKDATPPQPQLPKAAAPSDLPNSDSSPLKLDEEEQKMMNYMLQMFNQEKNGKPEVDESNLKALNTELESALKGLFQQLDVPSNNKTAPTASSSTEQSKNKTIQSLNAAAEKVEAMRGSNGAMDDPAMLTSMLENLVKDMEKDPEMQSMVDNLLDTMINKDILLEPLQHLKKEFPPWLEANRDKISKEKLVQYDQQLSLINKICDIYDQSKDANATETKATVHELFSQIHSLGALPEELMTNVSPGEGVPSVGDMMKELTGLASAGDGNLPQKMEDIFKDLPAKDLEKCSIM